MFSGTTIDPAYNHILSKRMAKLNGRKLRFIEGFCDFAIKMHNGQKYNKENIEIIDKKTEPNGPVGSIRIRPPVRASDPDIPTERHRCFS